jgi:hypothetical protein
MVEFLSVFKVAHFTGFRPPPQGESRRRFAKKTAFSRFTQGWVEAADIAIERRTPC